MANGAWEIGKLIQKTEDLDTRLERVEDKLDKLVTAYTEAKGAWKVAYFLVATCGGAVVLIGQWVLKTLAITK